MTMKRHLLTLAYVLAYGCSPLPAQTIEAAMLDLKRSDGSFAEAEVELAANSIMGFDANKNPVRVEIGTGLTVSGSPLTLAATATGGTWGTITGTLSAQTDLQNALNAKFNASGVSAYGATLIDDADASAARSTLGLGTLATQSGTLTDYLTTATAATTYVSLAGSYSNPAWITSLEWSKITGTPTSISGYGITDTEWLGTVTGYDPIFGNGGTLTMQKGSNWSSAGSINTSTGVDGSATTVGGGGGGTLDLYGGTAAGGGGEFGDQEAAGGGGAGWQGYGGAAFSSSNGAWAGGNAGSLLTYGGNASEGTAGLAGGSITTHTGGGSINTRGTGSIQLGASGTRTTLNGAASSNWTLTLPTGPGTSGQVLTTNGSGTTSWTTVSGGGAHASSHVTGGSDKIRDASASQDGLMTSAYAAKLDGISANADKTEAAINSAPGETTLQDNDAFAFLDDSAFNVLKQIYWSNIKLELRDYFDLRYPRGSGNSNGTNTGDVTLAGTPDYLTISGQTITRGPIDLATDTTGSLAWASVSKTGSSLADLATRSAADLTNVPVEIGVACSDETSDLTTGDGKVTFRLPHAMTLTAVRASVTTASTGSTIIVDIKEGGASVLGTLLSIDGGEKTSTTAASAATITDSALADDAEITIDLDQIGSSTAGTGLKVWLIGTRN